jgi:cytochrome P450 PksS
MMRQLCRIVREQTANPREGLIAALIQAEESGDKLTEDEVLAMLFVLLLAGHETTVNLIASGTLALLENPEQLALLRSQPELIKTAIEEIVRYTNPVQEATERYTSEDITLHGVTIPKGEQVLAVLASANRDEQYFTNPDKFDITRQNNKHLGFGIGVHYCAGAPLARLEGQIALTNLIERAPSLRLAKPAHTLRWRSAMTVRGLEQLPVAF